MGMGGGTRAPVRMVTVRSYARTWLPAVAHAVPLSAVPGALFASL
jgi:hypothetical protein